MAQVHDVQTERRRGRPGLVVLTFLIGLMLIGVVVAMIMNVQATLSWPAGQFNFSFRPPAISSTAAQTATTEQYSAPVASAQSTTETEPTGLRPAVEATAPPPSVQ